MGETSNPTWKLGNSQRRAGYIVRQDAEQKKLTWENQPDGEIFKIT